MNTMHPRALRTRNKLYNCMFMGERAQDAGGPYRESWSMYAQELQVKNKNSRPTVYRGLKRYIYLIRRKEILYKK